jgi:excisionase family DNA binding protein
VTIVSQSTTSTPKLALTPVEAASALGMSRDSFDRYVRDELRLVRKGRLVLVPVRELERWIDRNAALTLEGER